MNERALTVIAAAAIGLAGFSCGGNGGTGTGGGGSPGTGGATASSSGSGGSSSSSAASTSSSGTGGLMSSTYNPLWIPPLLTGTTFDLTLSASTRQLIDGPETIVYGYNGTGFWGPTLVMNKGDVVQMHVKNDLVDETTTHWHGFHIPAAADGGPHQVIAPGTTWSPSFEVKNKAATYWYHPHLHHMTQMQLTYGAGGLMIVKVPEEEALPLPRTYGVDDIPVVLTSRRFMDDNQFDISSAYGDYMLTNGVMRAKVDLPAQVVRLRILNVETERAYNLGFGDDRTFYVIATDGGLVNAPVPVTRVKLFVGERVEILVDLSKDAAGSSLDLKAYNGGLPFGFPGGEPQASGMFGSLLNNTTFDVLHIDVAAPTAGAITGVPATLANNTYWTDADVTNSRTLHITDMGPGTPFTFDGELFDETVINQTVALNAVEKWTISNGMTFSHAFHIHDVQFKIVSRSSGVIADYEQGWKDTVSVPINESVSFIARFDDFASSTDPYMYHCHMSNHEDEGTMGQFLVK
ncbi:MAG: multicopper oxidase domain-containing protein [Minicystis sp.]